MPGEQDPSLNIQDGGDLRDAGQGDMVSVQAIPGPRTLATIAVKTGKHLGRVWQRGLVCLFVLFLFEQECFIGSIVYFYLETSLVWLFVLLLC